MKSATEIKNLFGKRLIGNPLMKKVVCKTLTLFPNDIIRDVTEKVWFISSFDDAWGFTLRIDELKAGHLIFLSEDLLKDSPQQQRYTIAHEIGHVVLGHKNAILENQTKKDIRRQEKQADQFAKKYLKG